MDFLRFLEIIISIAMIGFAIKILNNKGISIGSYKKNFHLKISIVFVLLGIFIRTNYLFFPYQYFLKDTIEPVISIIIIYIIMAIVNRNEYLDKPKINDFVGGLLIVTGIVIFTAFIVI